MPAPRLFATCGLPFSGKSTLSRAIADRLGCPLVVLDDINAQRGLDGGQGVPPAEWDRTSHLALDMIADHMRAGAGVILVDDTVCFRFLRDRYRAVARVHGYAVRFIHVDTPLETIRARMRANEETQARGGLTPEVFESCVNSFQGLGADESSIRFAPEEHDLETWIEEQFPAAG